MRVKRAIAPYDAIVSLEAIVSISPHPVPLPAGEGDSHSERFK